MLLLERMRGEQIYIGKDIVIELVSITDRRALIGVLAPEELKVLRGEHLNEDEIED